MKKKGQKCLTLSVWWKPLNLWQENDKKNLERKDQERNRRDRQKEAFEKVRSDSYMFFKKRDPIGWEDSSRNRVSHENMLDWSKGIGQESKELETLS